MPPNLKPAYLIHGDDHGRIAERRANFRALAEKLSGAAGLEVFEGDQSTPDNVAGALNAMTFAIGRRFIVVDGVERWKDKECDALVRALKHPDPDTTVSFFAREEGRLKVPKALLDAVRKAGGDIATEEAVKPWELPKWVTAQARALGLDLSPEAARAIVAHVGDRQQRLLRELEKLALEFNAAPAGQGSASAPDGSAAPGGSATPGGSGATGGSATPGGSAVTLTVIDADAVESLTAASAERKAWSLADALLTGDAPRATRTLLQIRQQGERLPGLIYWMSSRLRDAHRMAAALEAGQSQSDAKRLVRMPPKAADQLLRDAQRIGSENLRGAIELIADLEYASRGGNGRGVTEDTSALLAIREISAV